MTGKNANLARVIIVMSILLAISSSLDKNTTTIGDGPRHVGIPVQSWYNNTQTPITIDGNTYPYGWMWARTQPWCRSGSGNPNDPYIIENVTIDCGGPMLYTYGIKIMNSGRYFTIRNCTIHNANMVFLAKGIYLQDTIRGNISKNIIYNCDYGVYLENARNATISRNSIGGQMSGIYVRPGSSYNAISRNNISYNFITALGIECSGASKNTFFGNNITKCGAGVVCYNSWNNTFSGNNMACVGGLFFDNSTRNTVKNNSINGSIDGAIKLTYSSDNNSITGNHAIGNTTGIELYNATGNKITGNIATGLTKSGIALTGISNNNTISCNNASSHPIGDVAYGLKIEKGSKYNQVYLNNLDARIAGSDVGNTLNTWDNGTLGNWYSDYVIMYPTATHGEVIWNTPYAVSANTSDRYPLYLPYDSIDRVPAAAFMANDTLLVGSGWVQFNFTGSGGNVPFTFDWDFDDGFPNATDCDPARHFASPGNYTITLTVKDKDGDQDTESMTIEVQADVFPAASFMSNDTAIIGSGWIQFTFTGSEGNSPASFDWDFGDGMVHSAARNPAHHFVYPGNFTVTLHVVDANGDSDSDTMGIEVILDNMSSASFVANQTTIVEGSSIQFNFTGNDGNGGLQFQWNFGDGLANATGRNPSHQFLAAGNRTVTLTVNDTDGDRAVQRLAITVVADVLPSVNFTANWTIILEEDSVRFTFTGVEGNAPVQFQWGFGDGSPNSTDRDPVHKFASAGIFTVVLTITDLDGDYSRASRVALIQVLAADDDVDIDDDGLTNEAEINVYHTDPNDADTDGDGYLDGSEVAGGSNPLDAASTPPPVAPPADTGAAIVVIVAACAVAACLGVMFVLHKVGIIKITRRNVPPALKK